MGRLGVSAIAPTFILLDNLPRVAVHVECQSQMSGRRSGGKGAAKWY